MKFAFVLVSLIACSKDSSPPPPPSPKVATPEPAPSVKPAPKGAWSRSSRTFQLEDKELKRGAEVRVMLVAGSLSVNAVDLPIGTIVEVGDMRGEVTDKHGNRFEVPMDRAVGDAPWDRLKPTGKYRLAEEFDWNVPMTITLPGRESVKTKLPELNATTGLEKLFLALATTDRTWPEESKGPAPAAAAWTVNGFEAIGNAEKTRDVRMVAIGKQVDNARTKRCTGHVGAKDFTATSFDLELSIVDRVTKQTLATKTFTGQPSCPQTVVTGPGTPPAAHTGPSHKPMIAWVSSQLPALAKKL